NISTIDQCFAWTKDTSFAIDAGAGHDPADTCRHLHLRMRGTQTPPLVAPTFMPTLSRDDTREHQLTEWVGVAIALLSSCLGGTAAAITRYLAGNTDPVTLAILRWGIGFLCVLPAAIFLRAKWPGQRDWPAVAALGFAFFAVFFVLYNIALSYTTAARASLAL